MKDFLSKQESEQLSIVNQSNAVKLNLFHLQVKQLLKTICCKTKKLNKIYNLEQCLHSLHRILNEECEYYQGQEISQESLQLRGLRIRNYIKRKEVRLTFQKPNRVDVVGSYLLNTMIKSEQPNNVDLAVEMPSECFVPKDFQNFRYLDKRFLYLGVLASELKRHKELFSDVQFSAANGNMAKPILVLFPRLALHSDTKGEESRLQIRLFPVIQSDTLQLSKLVPTRCNVSPKSRDDGEEINTPHYTNSILEDMMMTSHLRQLHATGSECSCFAEACLLVKIWIQQRGFQHMIDSLNGFLGSMFLYYLMGKGYINLRMSAEQMFKVLMGFLVRTDFSSLVLVCPVDEDGVELNEEGKAAFKNAFEVCLIDPSGRLNLTGRITKSAMKEVANEAKKTTALLQDGSISAFRAVFIQKATFWNRYDQIAWIPAPAPLHKGEYSSKQKQLINDVGLMKFWSRKVASVVAQGLTDRVTESRIYCPSECTWGIDEDLPKLPKIALGLYMNGEAALRLVDKGPAADCAADAKAFRQFWGNKAELRRFKDGSIIESVVWDVPSNDRSRIVCEIVSFALKRHLPGAGSDEETAMFVQPRLLDCVPRDPVPVAESTQTLWSVFDTLTATIRGLQTLPLPILDLQPVDAAFRYTSNSPPQPHPLAFSDAERIITNASQIVNQVLHPLVVVVRFEESASWPDDLAALLCTKTAFYVHLCRELQQRGLRCEVTREFVDVFTRGFVFRFVIFCDKEVKLYQIEKSIAADRALFELRKQCLYGPRHQASIHALHQRNGAYGPSVRLASKWVKFHGLDSHVCIEAIELLVAHVFLSPMQFATPHSILAGFMRFLQLIFSFDWSAEPLIVNLYDATSEASNKTKDGLDLVKMSERPAMCIVAQYDVVETSSIWTKSGPDSVILARFQACARQSYRKLNECMSTGDISAKSLGGVFASPGVAYDIGFQIHDDVQNVKRPRVDSESAFHFHYYKNVTKLTKVKSFVGMDPVADLIKMLRERYGELAIFSMDYEGSMIQLVWRPLRFLPTKFRVLKSNLLHPVALPVEGGETDTESNGVASHQENLFSIPHILSIVSEIKQMSQGIISFVHFQQQ